MDHKAFVQVGRIIKAARKNYGLSQKEVAKAIKVSPQMFCNWERGAAMPPAKYWKKIDKRLFNNPDSFQVQLAAIYYVYVLRMFK